ncbi:MAG: transporter substrate-binding domain-containing protein [Clostridia bacterium]|nr:transporter substrate-binding domain-containing protein [Clostridia bacterium]
MKKIISLILCAVLVVGVFALAGCSDDTQTKEPETPATKVININLTEEDYAFGVDKNQPELLAKVNTFIAQIMKDGTFDTICDRYFGDGEPVAVESAPLDTSKDQLVVATNAAFAPFEYMEGDKYYGIDMEIAKLLADYLGMELVINNMKFEAVCLSVGQHQCDIAMAGLTVNEERKEHVTFSDSYYQASQQVIVKGDDTTFDACKTADDVNAILNGYTKDKVVGVQNGTTGMYYVQGDADWGFDGLPTDCKTYEAGSLAVQDMINGNIDMVIIDAAPAASIVEAINAVA